MMRQQATQPGECDMEGRQMTESSLESSLESSGSRAAAPAQPEANEWKEAVLDALANACFDVPVGTPPAEIIAKIIETNVAMALEDAAPELALGIMPIAKLTVDVTGNIASSSLYAPGLPPGDHDVYPEPLDPSGQAGPSMFAKPEAPAVKPLDDPRLQELFSTTIDGALTSGYQGVAPAPAGHWLEYWWNKGRAVAVEAPQPQGEAPVAWRMRSLALRHRAPSSSG